PSGVPTMPSAVTKSAHTRCHSTPAATTPGIAVISTLRSPSSNGCCARSGLAAAHAAAAAVTQAATIVALIDRPPTSFEPEVFLDQPALIHVAVVAVRVARLALDQLAGGIAALRAARADERRRVERVVDGQRAVHRQP